MDSLDWSIVIEKELGVKERESGVLVDESSSDSHEETEAARLIRTARKRKASMSTHSDGEELCGYRCYYARRKPSTADIELTRIRHARGADRVVLRAAQNHPVVRERDAYALFTSLPFYNAFAFTAELSRACAEGHLVGGAEVRLGERDDGGR